VRETSIEGGTVYRHKLHKIRKIQIIFIFSIQNQILHLIARQYFENLVTNIMLTVT